MDAGAAGRYSTSRAPVSAPPSAGVSHRAHATLLETTVLSLSRALSLLSLSSRALSPLTLCRRLPPTGINFNDGFGGGAEIMHNLLFNTWVSFPAPF